MTYWKYNLLNLKWFFIFLLGPAGFIIYWKVTEATDAPYNVVLIAVIVLLVGISVGNYVAWRKLQ